MKKIGKILSVVLVLACLLCCVSLPASAASYPLIYMDTIESTPTIPVGEIGKLVFTIFPEYHNERYNVEIYDSDGDRVASASNSYYNTDGTFVRDITITVNTYDLELGVGTYEVKYWLEFYSIYEWHSAPNAYTSTFKVIANTCRGNHNLVYDRTAREGDCDTERYDAVHCTKCEYIGYVNKGYSEHKWEWDQYDENSHKAKCTECYESKYEDHTWEGTIVTFPTVRQPGSAEYVCKYCGETKVGTLEVLRNGWNWYCGKWYFCENGQIVKNSWRKDSKGWCYIGSDGAMKTNAWVRDSIGWCFVGADGYAVTNCWKKDTKGWCYLNSQGSMVKNNWVKDGGKWYYLDANGYMVSNKWMKDSKGWVYLASNGAMLTNAWCKDSIGWCYVGANGYAVTNCWKQDSKGWCYLNSQGSMIKNNWVKDGGYWYYLDGNGYMISNTSRKINGKTYRFNAKGICTNP